VVGTRHPVGQHAASAAAHGLAEQEFELSHLVPAIQAAADVVAFHQQAADLQADIATAVHVQWGRKLRQAGPADGAGYGREGIE